MSLSRRMISLLLLATSWSCKQKEASPSADNFLPQVSVVEAAQRTIPVYSEYVGQTYGQSDVEVTSRVDGWVTGIHFKEGGFVDKGTLLYTIDDQPMRNMVDQANANLAQANTQLVRTKADLERVEPLARMNALSRRDLEAAQAAYKAAQYQVDAASAALRNSKIQLDYAQIKAPISGIIGISKVQPGSYVSRISAAGALNTISAVGDMRIRFSITENEYLAFKRKYGQEGTSDLGQITVSLILSDGKPYPQTGKLNVANRQVDPETGSLLLQAIFPNKELLLRPGQYVKVKMMTDEYANAVLVPQQAVNQLQNVHQVFILNDSSRITPRIIRTGARIGSNWIVADGLKSGERVALVGNAVIKPDMKVDPRPLTWNYDSTSRQ